MRSASVMEGPSLEIETETEKGTGTDTHEDLANGAAKGRTFPLDVSSDGAEKLRRVVREKLSEFMGSYTDDVLAEYVVVLVGHGKQQTQAAADLEAFLGEQTEAFVAWLWDHLTANKRLYTSVENEYPRTIDEEQKPDQTKCTVETQNGQSGENKTVENDNLPVKSKKHSEHVSTKSRRDDSHAHSSEKVKSEHHKSKGHESLGEINSSEHHEIAGKVKSEHRDEHHDAPGRGKHKDGYSSMRETHNKDNARPRESKRRRSPEPWSRRGKGRLDSKEAKDDMPDQDRLSPHPRISPPRVSRRLLESAVRDAVAPAGTTRKDKRLRSVVALDNGHPDSMADSNGKTHDVRPRHTLAKQGGMLIAMKAAADAADDVNSYTKGKCRFAGSVWDRLGHRPEPQEEVTTSTSKDEITMQPAELENLHAENRRGASNRPGRVENTPASVSDHSKVEYSFGGDSGNIVLEERINIDKQAEQCIEEIPESRESLPWKHDRNPRNFNNELSMPHIKSEGTSFRSNQENKVVLQSGDAMGKTEGASVNNEDTHDEPLFVASSSELQIRSDDSDIKAEKDVLDMKRKLRQVELEMTKLRARQDEVAKEVQKAATTPTPGVVKPLLQSIEDDADSRTVFITNVHFATTKEAISAHFSSCGDVVKVTLLTDGVSGKPKGSAYVEFFSKDAVDKALALNDSCLLSRPLKVVRKDAASHESGVPVRTQLRQPMHLPIRTIPRGPYLRGSPYPLRPPRALRPFTGAVHMQWKREVSGGTNGNQTCARLDGAGVGAGVVASSVASSKSGHSVNGYRSAVGPVRSKKSFSYVRNAVSTETAVTVQDQKSNQL